MLSNVIFTAGISGVMPSATKMIPDSHDGIEA